jgi:hypothetical protein
VNHHRVLSDEETARLATLVAAAQAAAADWVSAELTPTALYADEIDRWSEDRLTVWLPLNSSTPSDGNSRQSHLVVAMDEAAARRFADRAFVEVGVIPDRSLLGDCVAEFANLIAGRMKALTSGTPEHFLLGLPKLESPPSGEHLVAVLTGEIGEVVVAVRSH